MINLRHIKFLVIIIFSLLLSNQSFKDNFNSPKDYSMFENHNEVKFVNLTSSKCKKKVTLGGFHGIALTKCFANEDPRSKEITKYLEGIF